MAMASTHKTTKSRSKQPIKAAAVRRPRIKGARKVDIYPNRMTFWVSAAAGSLLVLLAVIVTYR